MSDTELETVKDKYPMARVALATSLEEVFEVWKDSGLSPVEIASEDAIQRITIEHNPFNGKLTWTTSKNMDGLCSQLITLNALVLMPSLILGDTAVSIADYFTTGKGRIDLGTGEAAVVIAFKDGRLSMDSMPKDNPIAVRKLIAAVLLYLLSKDNGHMLENLLQSFGVSKL